MHSLRRFQGKQHRPLYPIHRDIVVKLLLLEPPDHPACAGWRGGCRLCWEFMERWRDALGTAVLTVGCCRTEDGDMQSCDFWSDADAEAGYVEFEGGCTFNIKRQKNDQHRRGCRRRCCRSKDPRLDIVDQTRSFLREAGLEPHPRCKKRVNPSEHCPLCPPLFPLSSPGGFGFQLRRPPTGAQISNMIVRAVGSVGVNTAFFSGICARKGGLSTAIEKGVPEVVLWMQSGHAQNIAARRYIELGSPKLFYDTWAAFDL